MGAEEARPSPDVRARRVKTPSHPASQTSRFPANFAPPPTATPLRSPDTLIRTPIVPRGSLESIVHDGVEIQLDEDHNPDGIDALASPIKVPVLDPAKTELVFGSMAENVSRAMLLRTTSLGSRRFCVAPNGRVPASVEELVVCGSTLSVAEVRAGLLGVLLVRWLSLVVILGVPLLGGEGWAFRLPSPPQRD